MVNKEPEKSLMKHSDNFRKVQESKSLIDLGDTIKEKYGQENAWKVTLRQPQIEFHPSRNHENIEPQKRLVSALSVYVVRPSKMMMSQKPQQEEPLIVESRS